MFKIKKIILGKKIQPIPRPLNASQLDSNKKQTGISLLSNANAEFLMRLKGLQNHLFGVEESWIIYFFAGEKALDALIFLSVSQSLKVLPAAALRG